MVFLGHLVFIVRFLSKSTNRLFPGCDDIIRQHKAACLRITALLACKDILWIGTSAGVVATMHIPLVPKQPLPKGQRIAQLPPLVGKSN